MSQTSGMTVAADSDISALLTIPDASTLKQCMDPSALSLPDDKLPSCCFCVGPLPDCPWQVQWDGTADKIAASCSTVRLRGERIGTVHAVCMVKHVIESRPNSGMLCPQCGYKHHEKGDVDTMVLLDQPGHEAAYRNLKNMREDEVAEWMMLKMTDKTLADWMGRVRTVLTASEADQVLAMWADLGSRHLVEEPDVQVFVEESDESEEE